MELVKDYAKKGLELAIVATIAAGIFKITEFVVNKTAGLAKTGVAKAKGDDIKEETPKAKAA